MITKFSIAAIGIFTSMALGVQGSETQPEPPEFKQVNRPGSVDLDETYDMEGLQLPREQIHTLLPKDAIPALTDPKRIKLGDADYLKPEDRVVDVTIGSESVAVPLKILNFHEIANMVIGGTPVAASYCPLCDSVTLFERTVRITPSDPKAEAHDVVLEFGVSGALFNSNVLMYDRTHNALWSQLGLRAVSGPLVGTELKMLPVRVVSFSEYTLEHPKGRVLSSETGHGRSYDADPYVQYFENQERLLVPVAEHGDELPKKTLGLGIVASDEAIFVPAAEIGDRFVIKTKLGEVVASSSDAGVRVISSPEGVHSVQSFYYSFSAFHPHTRVQSESD